MKYCKGNFHGDEPIQIPDEFELCQICQTVIDSERQLNNAYSKEYYHKVTTYQDWMRVLPDDEQVFTYADSDRVNFSTDWVSSDVIKFLSYSTNADDPLNKQVVIVFDTNQVSIPEREVWGFTYFCYPEKTADFIEGKTGINEDGQYYRIKKVRNIIRREVDIPEGKDFREDPPTGKKPKKPTADDNWS